MDIARSSINKLKNNLFIYSIYLCVYLIYGAYIYIYIILYYIYIYIPASPKVKLNEVFNGCSHCGAPFETRAGLRRHITDGRCPSFNPSATNVPLPAARKWETLMAMGDFTRQGLTAHQRLQRTLACQLCGETYSRCIDLSAHLQQSHAGLWMSDRMPEDMPDKI